MPPKKTCCIPFPTKIPKLSARMQRLNKEIEQVILSDYYSSTNREEINIVVIWIGYRQLHTLPCLNASDSCPYETLLQDEKSIVPNFEELKKRKNERVKALEEKTSLLVLLTPLLPKVLVHLLSEFLEIPVMPFVCEFSNTVWLDAWMIDTLRYLRTVIVYTVANANRDFQEDFLLCLKDDNPSFQPKVYYAFCYPRNQISLNLRAQRYENHTCRGCVKIKECKIQCLCRYHYYCSLKCKEDHYRCAIRCSGRSRSIYSFHSFACWKDRQSRPQWRKSLILDDDYVGNIQANQPLTPYAQEIVDHNIDVEEIIYSNSHPNLRNKCLILNKHFPHLKMVIYKYSFPEDFSKLQ